MIPNVSLVSTLIQNQNNQNHEFTTHGKFFSFCCTSFWQFEKQQMTKRRFILRILDSRIQSFSPASGKRIWVLKNMHVVWKAHSLNRKVFRRSEFTGFERISVALA